jgi:hypothetical protein
LPQAIIKTSDVPPHHDLTIVIFFPPSAKTTSLRLQLVTSVYDVLLTILILHTDRCQKQMKFEGLHLRCHLVTAMKKFRFSQKYLLTISVIGIVWFCHHFIFRPMILDWGAPQALRNLELSGDTFTNGDQHTRAILVDATPDELWPWLVQIGQERAGFYSHQWLENLFFADMNNVYSIDSRFQQPRRVGDTVWLANKERYNGGGYQIIAEITPSRSYVMVGGSDYESIQKGQKASGSWAFYLYPISETRTWIIVRSPNGEISAGAKLLRYFTFEVPHFIMEARMLNTLKRLAEEKS